MSSRLRSTVENRPIATFFLLAYALTWGLLPLIRFSPVFGLLALLAPATAALVVAGITCGRDAARGVLRRIVIWRVSPWYYLVALGLPPAIGYLVAQAASIRDGGPVHLAPVTPITWVLFALIVGEELGWRGYAQPALAARHSPVAAALIVGVLWGFWHLPTFFLEGMPQRVMPFPAFLGFTMAFSVVAGWVLERARGSVLLAMTMHGSFNSFTFGTPTLGVATRLWWTALVWTLVAIGTAVSLRRDRRLAPLYVTR